MNKNVKINFRVSPYEKKLLFANVRRAKMNLSKFCRQAVLGKGAKLIEGLPECNTQLARIGNNLNQIARALNQGGQFNPNLNQIQVELHTVFDKVSKILGGEIGLPQNQRFCGKEEYTRNDELLGEGYPKSDK